MQQTPAANRVSIALVGRRNVGKSTLINLLTGQNVALVSPQAGTTTDPVTKSSELYPLGSVLYIDTAGLDDEGELGELRVKATWQATQKADAFLLLIKADQTDSLLEEEWLKKLATLGKPLFLVLSACDLVDENSLLNRQKSLQERLKYPVLTLSQKDEVSLNALKETLSSSLKEDDKPLVADTLAPESLVILVMPQDKQAPKGRLILPQVQVLRELLDYHHNVLCCTFNNFSNTLSLLNRQPDLIITDSQLFDKIKPLIQEDQNLTSFSILMAGKKGDLSYYKESVKVIDLLQEGDTILILESCSHHALKHDIGRDQIPAKIKTYKGLQNLNVRVHSGSGLPNNLTNIKLIIQCGACMIGRSENINRLNQLKELGLPVTNYGVLLERLSFKLKN